MAPMLMARAIPIGAEETGGSLHDRLAALGADIARLPASAMPTGLADD